MSEPLIELTAEQLRSRRGKKWRAHEPDMYPAWVADMDFLTAEPVRRALQEIANDADFCYSSQPDEVPTAFAARMESAFGWHVRADHTVLVADLVQGVTASILAFSRPGDGVALMSPSYPPLADAVRSTGRGLVDVPLVASGSRYEVEIADLTAALGRESVSMLLLCNPHNPTGRVFDRSELAVIAAAAASAEVTVVSDEIHCDLVYPGAEFVPFATVDPRLAQRTVSLHSATKSFNLGGLRCGILHFGSEALLRRFQEAHPDRLLGRPNTFGALATTVAWQQGQPWLDSVRARLRENRDVVRRWVDRTPGLSSHAPEGTYFCWLDCAGLGLDEPAAAFFRREARVAMSAGETFGPGYRAFVRLNFAMSPTILAEVLGRLESAIGRAAPAATTGLKTPT
ncbi:MalY/PatB family protein [Streptomyces antimycoticus]|uniref:MalY/PatB family protein n=1 Tax=Streptomyces antimycoticus TaxID=68175 RepID=UPI00367666FC